MMTTAKGGKKIIGMRGIVGVLLLVVCCMVPLIQTPDVYAESKKASGSLKGASDLARHRIQSTAYKPPIPVGELNNFFGIFSSDDPEWNNATFYSVWYIENLNFIGHGVVTHPGGDQTFRIVKGKIKALNVHEWTAEYRGYFIGGTGKYKGIQGSWKEKTVNMSAGLTTEWEVEYEIK